MVKYGLIGKGLKHSFSAKFFNRKFRTEGLDCHYDLYDIENIGELKGLLASHLELKGLNITSPYKREVIQFMDELSPEASTLNAVNVVEIKSNGKLKGYNTDWEGFYKTLLGIGLEGKKALIMGTGGAASAVALALEKSNIPYKLVSRKPTGNEISYEEMNRLLPSCEIIVNATPLGMYPLEHQCPPIDITGISEKHICYDLIYNPAVSKFLRKAKEQGAAIKNGMEMLINQAELSWQIWNED